MVSRVHGFRDIFNTNCNWCIVRNEGVPEIVIIILNVQIGFIQYYFGIFIDFRNVGLIYLLFILYDISVLMLAFLMTTFFDKARVKPYF